jgi:hypothetical protein
MNVCKECSYFNAEDGHCYRFPPSCTEDRSAANTNTTSWSHPLVNSDDAACGEFVKDET